MMTHVSFRFSRERSRALVAPKIFELDVTLRHCRHRQDGRGTNFPLELGLTHGTEKEGRADWHLAILTLPPAWTGRGCSRAKSSADRARKK